MTNFGYVDMLSGYPIPVEGVGRLKSPKLSDIFKSGGLGYKGYNLLISFLTWNIEEIVKYDKLVGINAADVLLKNDKLTTYDAITLVGQTRELCRDVLSFFMCEKVIWDEQSRSYITFVVNEDGDRKAVGSINKANFDEVKSLILNLNYIGLDKLEDKTKDAKFESEQAKKLWDQVQQRLNELSDKKPEAKDKPEYHLANIVSKLCALGVGYNLINVWELTIFQLYDAFFQASYLRSSDLNERIFSNHGGKDFKFESWLKPITKYL